MNIDMGLVKEPTGNDYDIISQEVDRHLAHADDDEVVVMNFDTYAEANRVRNAMMRRDYVVSIRKVNDHGKTAVYISGRKN